MLTDPAAVAQSLRAASTSGKNPLADHIARGGGYLRALGRAPAAAAAVGAKLERGADVLLRPAYAEGAALGAELADAGQRLRRPGVASAIGGLALAAPILGVAGTQAQQAQEGDLMHARHNGEMKAATLEDFLEKKAEFQAKTASYQQQLRALGSSIATHVIPTVGENAFKDFAKGIGAGVGGGLATLLLGGAAVGARGLTDKLFTDPKRKQMFARMVHEDAVIADALRRSPQAEATLVEAYATMVRFAPSLSLDPNAVRSFLREAVVGGSAGVNYATIKSLIETENTLSRGSRG